MQNETDLGMSLKDKLNLLNLINEVSRGSERGDHFRQFFQELRGLTTEMINGSKIIGAKKASTQKDFKAIDIVSAEGDMLGQLNMIFYDKPVPFYYLIYVEVFNLFRNQKLGTKMLVSFREFLKEKKTVGVLENIIPADDPAYNIYKNNGWVSVKSLVEEKLDSRFNDFMLFVPEALKIDTDDILLLLEGLEKQRVVIDAENNKEMVRQTIEEFKDLHGALEIYFGDRIEEAIYSPSMIFLFSRFAARFISFKKKIRELLGYTGGESTEQIKIDQRILDLPIRFYTPRELNNRKAKVIVGEEWWKKLPEKMRKKPAREIEKLKNYERPVYKLWLSEKGYDNDKKLTIGDLLDAGFDPTRLKEINIEGEEYIFERIYNQDRIRETLAFKNFLEKKKEIIGKRAANARILVNEPLMILENRGNIYVLRRKIKGIHSEEALLLIKKLPHLKKMDKQLNVGRIISATIKSAQKIVKNNSPTFFIPWNFITNQPEIVIDMTGVWFEKIWVS